MHEEQLFCKWDAYLKLPASLRLFFRLIVHLLCFIYVHRYLASDWKKNEEERITRKIKFYKPQAQQRTWMDGRKPNEKDDEEEENWAQAERMREMLLVLFVANSILFENNSSAIYSKSARCLLGYTSLQISCKNKDRKYEWEANANCSAVFIHRRRQQHKERIFTYPKDAPNRFAMAISQMTINNNIIIIQILHIVFDYNFEYLQSK